MTRPITVGVDGSPESTAAARWAAREAVRRDLPLRIVHVWRWETYDFVAADDRQAQADGAGAVVREAERTVTGEHPRLHVTAEAVEGASVDALAAEAAGSELLALGTRGHGAVLGFLLGSIGQQVLGEASRPVVLVRSEDRPAQEAAGREVVVGQHGGPADSAAALEFAFGAAAARGAGLRVVRAWSLPPVFAYSPGSMQLLDDAGGLEPYERKALDEALRPWRGRFPDVPVTEHVEMGSAGQVLLSVADRAQLMVVGRRAGRLAVGPRIGSVAHALIAHAPCPVAVVPPA
ncbi:nucleotide-binding universal stress UspA family protein [Streptomyces sp. B3I7]|uniref:universal stress protein n=1 Tax=Streptomyces sp. B3I7 TaxID=3042269 RepID=UPI002786C124|nr:universal stress protein [Streptomyces sp. B3I7]MDQ0815051.1 nucleotide-binding universal stress UspA family protein [Streptomyces sp. B3I7]